MDNEVYIKSNRLFNLSSHSRRQLLQTLKPLTEQHYVHVKHKTLGSQTNKCHYIDMRKNTYIIKEVGSKLQKHIFITWWVDIKLFLS